KLKAEIAKMQSSHDREVAKLTAEIADLQKQLEKSKPEEEENVPWTGAGLGPSTFVPFLSSLGREIESPVVPVKVEPAAPVIEPVRKQPTAVTAPPKLKPLEE